MSTDPLYGVPDAATLLDAVEHWLRAELRPGLEGRDRFQAAVAANVIATVARELRAAPADRPAHADDLATLGVGDEAALAAAIRSGALDDRHDEVVAVLRRSVAARLGVANPRWA